MCNEYARRLSPEQLRAGWQAVDAALIFPEGTPNMPPLESIRITDPGVIIRACSGVARTAEVITRRWSWPAPNGKPVYNFRSEGRTFENKPTSGRCLIIADGFYEFTDESVATSSAAAGEPALTVTLFGEEDRTSPGATRKRTGKAAKAKWELRMKGVDWFGIAGLWRTHPDVGEAWTMLTTEPGPDIAPYHDRQIVLLTPRDYGRWLDGSASAAEICRPLPAGMLDARRVR